MTTMRPSKIRAQRAEAMRDLYRSLVRQSPELKEAIHLYEQGAVKTSDTARDIMADFKRLNPPERSD